MLIQVDWLEGIAVGASLSWTMIYLVREACARWGRLSAALSLGGAIFWGMNLVAWVAHFVDVRLVSGPR